MPLLNANGWAVKISERAAVPPRFE